MPTLGSIAVLVGLVVFDGSALAFGILASRSTSKNSGTRKGNAAFWGVTGGYLAFAALPGLMRVVTTSTPQVEGLGAFSALFVFSGLTLPGSILPFLASFGISMSTIPRPFGFSSGYDWLVIGALSWQFFLIVGVRWLTQRDARRRSHSGGSIAGSLPKHQTPVVQAKLPDGTGSR